MLFLHLQVGTGRGGEEKERDQLSSFLQVKAEEEQREQQ